MVPRKLIRRDVPGLDGTAYWDLVQIAEEMHDIHPDMRYDPPSIITD